MAVLLEVKNLTTQFYMQESTIYAVNGISYTVNKGETFGESGVGNPLEQGVVNVIERKGLLDIVPHLVDSDIETLVVHPPFADAGAQVCFLRAHGGPRRPVLPRADLSGGEHGDDTISFLLSLADITPA